MMSLPRTMRPPRTERISVDLYATESWPALREQLVPVVRAPPLGTLRLGARGPAVGGGSGTASQAQEPLNRAVFNLCTQRHAARLYDDLLRLVTAEAAAAAAQVSALPHEEVLLGFGCFALHFSTCVAYLCSIFRHLERVHVVPHVGEPLDRLLGRAVARAYRGAPALRAGVSAALPFWDPLVHPAASRALVTFLYTHDRPVVAARPDLCDLYVVPADSRLPHDRDVHMARELLLARPHRQGEDQVVGMDVGGASRAPLPGTKRTPEW